MEAMEQSMEVLITKQRNPWTKNMETDGIGTFGIEIFIVHVIKHEALANLHDFDFTCK
jgi:hypothetical protein